MEVSSIKLIERLALGRSAKIGDLYDARLDKFCGVSLFTEAPGNAVVVTDNPSQKTDFFYAETFSEKAEALNISGELQASLLFIKLPTIGFNYLSYRKSCSHRIQETVLCEVTTKHEEIDLLRGMFLNIVAPARIQNTGATHVVVGISWGGKVGLSAEFFHEESKASQSGTLLLLGNKIEEARKGLSLNGGDPSSPDTASFELFGDPIPVGDEGIVDSFEVACRRLSQFGSHVKSINNGKGVPVKYILFPVLDQGFKDHFHISSQLEEYKEVQEALVIEIMQLFADIASVKHTIDDFVRDVDRFQDYLAYEKVRAVRELQSELEMGESELRSAIGGALTELRAGSRDALQKVKQLTKNYVESKRYYLKIQETCERDFIDLRRKIAFAKLCRKYKIKYLKECSLIDSWLIGTRDVYVLNASDTAIKQQSNDWTKNMRAFFNIAKCSANIKDVESVPLMLFVNSSLNPSQENIRLERYRNRLLARADVAEEQEEYLSHSVARSDAIEAATPRDGEAMDKVKLPCPRSTKGKCGFIVRDWLCYKCLQPLLISNDEEYFHCSCGRALAASFGFRCEDKKNHKMEDFTTFDDINDALFYFAGEVFSFFNCILNYLLQVNNAQR